MYLVGLECIPEGLTNNIKQHILRTVTRSHVYYEKIQEGATASKKHLPSVIALSWGGTRFVGTPKRSCERRSFTVNFLFCLLKSAEHSSSELHLLSG